ncbi:BRCA1-like protein [Volvox carteri f. nagariensis]|uniref:RING-type E3 ubiquitin transferase BRCA1 n=1 Tax=Volvox carteri f. nagariensis TaxID=3068 RepID=D8U2B1_VOLCA|nr:BRCA1-like protein [Volvox carteri f. nagariensis]EFJ46032.1 BRCA1-like protein [Volvox carteri f. nagariensis]|eukprot:XP_002952782.1 BRCA1-like protein [Volvox carteri f. nagariensis]
MFTLAPDIRALQAACSAFVDACKCPLCGLPWRKASTFPCGHTFCYECAIATLEGPGISQSECPKCKAKYWKRDLKPNPQMMAVVEHTQKILGIGALHAAAGAAGNRSSGAAPESDAGCESPFRGCNSAIGLSLLAQARACTNAAGSATDAVKTQDHGLEQGGAGATSPGLHSTQAAAADRHRAVALLPAMAGEAALQPLHAGSATKATPHPCNPVDQGSEGQSAGTVPMLQRADALPTCAEAAPPGPAPGSPWVDPGARPLAAQDASRYDRLGPAGPGHDLAYGEFVTPNTAEVHGATGGLPDTPPVLRPVSLATGHHVLPAAAMHELPHTSHGPLVGAGGGWWEWVPSRHSAEGALQVPPLLPSVVATTPLAHGEKQGPVGQECRPNRSLGVIASSVAVATPLEQLVPQPRSQAPAAWASTTLLNGGPTAVTASGTGTGGAPPLRSSVVSIRRGTPSVNNAYLGFHALLEHPLGWISRSQPAGQLLEVAHAGRARAGPRWGDDEIGEFDEAEWWLRRLGELAGPTDQEREALEFELSIVSTFLGELGEMMAKQLHPGCCGDVVAADGRSARATSGEVPRGDACLPSLSAGVGLPSEQGCEARHGTLPGADLCQGDATCPVQQVGDSGICPPRHTGDKAAENEAPAAFDGFKADRLAAPVARQHPPKPHRELPSQQRMDGDAGYPALTSGAIQTSCSRGVDKEDRAAAACKIPTSEGIAAATGPRGDGADERSFTHRGRNKSSVQKQVACDGGTGSGRTSCTNAIGCDGTGAAAACAGLVVLPAACETGPALRCAHGGMAPTCTNDADADDVEASRRGACCKRARTEAVSPRLAAPPTSTPPTPTRIPECGICPAGLASGHKHEGEAVVLYPGCGDGEVTERPDGSIARPGHSNGASAVQLQAPPAAVLLRPPSPTPCPHQLPECGVDGAAPVAGPSEPKIPQQPQPQPHVKNAPASQRLARRPKPRERGSAAAAMASPEPALMHELSAPGPSARRPKLLYVLPSGLGPEERAKVKELTRNVRGLELLSEVQPHLTHLVVQLNAERRAVGRTIKYLRAVIQGCWVVGMDWVCECLAAGRLLPEGPFEATGDATHAGTPTTTRLRLERGDPPLFSGLKFCVTFLKGSFDRGITKPELEALLLAAGGTLVRRPVHRGGGGGAAATAAATRVTAAAALFGAAAAADLYDAGPSTKQPFDGETDGGGGSTPPLPGFPQVLVLVTPQSSVDVSRVLREWGCAPIQTQWVYDCISHYKLLPLEGFTVGLPPHGSTTYVS